MRFYYEKSVAVVADDKDIRERVEFLLRPNHPSFPACKHGLPKPVMLY
ncbi:hypothetical protein SAMN05444682_11175 [Parapedobacter indicus]|uniref:Uncharacterized protein n=1 Tax=Parapedobacter indicus TaxID=1477437 RepID=A0A1I3SKL6_9SPHI|nr:hypothetical protein CLV26_111124 [Parapedobacter indicus]SFJ58702.1 hypothetical protein SAMN05444682_11175 [Parapedobacter indicus]